MPLKNNPFPGFPVAQMPYLVLTTTASVGTPSQVGANTTAEHTFTVNGITTADMIISVNKPTHQTGLGIVNWRVSATNTVAITYMNNTGSGITPTASEVYAVAFTRVS